jgi:hypothetical protein
MFKKKIPEKKIKIPEFLSLGRGQRFLSTKSYKLVLKIE